MTEKIRIPIVVEGYGQVETSLEGVSRLLDKVGESAKRSGDGLAEMTNKGFSPSASAAIRNASFQVSDFIVQVQGGTAASRAMAMQLPQLLGGFGTAGAVAGMFAGFAPQIMAFFKSADEIAPFAKAMDELNDALGGVNVAAKDFDLKPVMKEFNGASAMAREGIVDLLKFKQVLAEVTASAAEKSLAGQLQSVGSYGTLDKLLGAYGSEKASDMAKQFGVELSVARDMLGDIRSGTLESTVMAEKYAIALARGNENGRKLAVTLVEAAKGAKDAAAAQSAISETLAKMGKAGSAGTIALDKEKAHKETPLDKLRFEARAADAGIAPQTLKEMDALNEAYAKRNVSFDEYIRLTNIALANDPVLAKAQKGIADALKEEGKGAQILNDYRQNNASSLVKIDNEASLSAMSERDRVIAEAQYKADDEHRKIKERIIQLMGSEEAAAGKLAEADEEAIRQKNRLAVAVGNAYDAQRTFEQGWTKAFNKYKDEAGNSAKVAEMAFTRATDGMADAMTQFVMTGKMSFSSLAQSMIADMIRMQMRAAMAPVTSALGSGFMSLFSGQSGAEKAVAADINSAGLGGFAKGGAFTAHAQAFANGGTFTNKIFNSPTPFLFANGSKFGVMGEAGEEAVMPLDRDSSGRLGVKAIGGGGGANVTVNIIESNDKAGQVQTRSNGGGLEIDAYVAQVLQRDMARNGPVTQGIASTFGLARAV